MELNQTLKNIILVCKIFNIVVDKFVCRYENKYS